AGLLARHGLTLAARFGTRPIYQLAITGNAVLADKIATLQADPSVLLAEANTVHRSPEARKNLVWVIGTAQEYAVQWAPDAIRLKAAHRRSTGAGMRVAVLDTGVDMRHPALAPHLLPGHDFVDGDTDPSEQGTPGDAGWGHGTHVAGIVALVAPGARIMPLRVLDAQGQGNTWVLAEALLHAVDPDRNPATDDGAHVINLSLGTVDPTALMGALTALASCTFVTNPDPLDDFSDAGYNDDRQRCGRSTGAVVVAAAGNGGDRRERQYPAAEGAYGLIPVGATKAGNLMADFSNSGSWINLAAPGDHITSTLPGGGYGTWGGTSMAAPMVAGAAALLRALEPTLDAVAVVRRLERRSAALCGNARQRQLDVAAAVAGSRLPNLVCP
ncbi:MAG: S8 family serine peptidase, partial [Rubrivivax sp.]|nr:S8 family serine peptidase [Rubrivivax sp.]